MGRRARLKQKRIQKRRNEPKQAPSLKNTILAFTEPAQLDELVWKGSHLLLIQLLSEIARVDGNKALAITEDLKNELLSKLMFDLYERATPEARTEYVNMAPNETAAVFVNSMSSGEIPMYTDFHALCEKVVANHKVVES